MSFTNPRRVKVPIEHIDFYQWPCISGETFPPALTAGAGTAAYSSVAGWPAIRTNTTSGVTGNAKAVWPITPIYAPRTGTFIGFTVSFLCNLSGAAVTGGFEVHVGANNLIGVRVNRGNSSDFQTNAYFANVATPDLRISPLDSNWHTVTMTVTTAGVLTVTFDTTTIATTTDLTNIPPTLIDTSQLSFLSVSNGASASSSYITNVKLSWS